MVVPSSSNARICLISAMAVRVLHVAARPESPVHSRRPDYTFVIHSVIIRITTSYRQPLKRELQFGGIAPPTFASSSPTRYRLTAAQRLYASFLLPTTTLTDQTTTAYTRSEP